MSYGHIKFHCNWALCLLGSGETQNGGYKLLQLFSGNTELSGKWPSGVFWLLFISAQHALVKLFQFCQFFMICRSYRDSILFLFKCNHADSLTAEKMQINANQTKQAYSTYMSLQVILALCLKNLWKCTNRAENRMYQDGRTEAFHHL